MKNAFCFILKALFVLEIRNVRLISKFMTSQPDKKAISYIAKYLTKGSQLYYFMLSSIKWPNFIVWLLLLCKLLDNLCMVIACQVEVSYILKLILPF